MRARMAPHALLPVLLAWMLALGPLPAAHAEIDDGGAATTETLGTPPPTDDSVVGKIATIACGLSVRALRVTGPETPVIVIAVSSCLLALLDAAVG